MAKDVIGYVECKECGYTDAEVKETRKIFQGKAIVMVWCPHPKCQSQHFPRSKEGSDRIRARMREVTGSVENNQPVDDDKPAASVPPVVEPKPVKQTLAESLRI